MTERMKLLKCLAAADFAVYEVRLFLDTHPTDPCACKAAAEYEQRAALLRERYEQQYGPLTIASAAMMCKADDDCGCTGDGWLNDPWPWDYVCINEGR